MKVLTRHVAKEVLIATLFVLVALVALIAFFDLVSQARNIGNRYSISMALFLTMLKLPSRLYEVMPIAALLGAVYTMSRLASNSEFTIMRVAGLSPFRLAGMMTVPALILIAMTYCLGEWLTPAADMMRNDMDNILFNRKLSARGYSSGVWVKDNVKEQQNAGQATVRFVNVHNLIAGEHSRTGAWRVFEFDKDGSLIRVLHAPEASYISGRGWHLKDDHRTAGVRTVLFTVGKTPVLKVQGRIDLLHQVMLNVLTFVKGQIRAEDGANYAPRFILKAEDDVRAAFLSEGGAVRQGRDGLADFLPLLLARVGFKLQKLRLSGTL